MIGRWLGASGYVPDAVVCSTAARARETWDLAAAGLAAAAPGAAPPVSYEPRVYEASVLGLLMLVREFDPGWGTALIVGHNPGLAELTAGLAGPDAELPAGYPTAFVAVLDCLAGGPRRHRGRPGCSTSPPLPTFTGTGLPTPGNRRLAPVEQGEFELGTDGPSGSWSVSTTR